MEESDVRVSAPSITTSASKKKQESQEFTEKIEIIEYYLGKFDTPLERAEFFRQKLSQRTEWTLGLPATGVI
jgi:hypothetical protein